MKNKLLLLITFVLMGCSNTISSNDSNPSSNISSSLINTDIKNSSLDKISFDIQSDIKYFRFEKEYGIFNEKEEMLEYFNNEKFECGNTFEKQVNLFDNEYGFDDYSIIYVIEYRDYSYVYSAILDYDNKNVIVEINLADNEHILTAKGVVFDFFVVKKIDLNNKNILFDFPECTSPNYDLMKYYRHEDEIIVLEKIDSNNLYLSLINVKLNEIAYNANNLKCDYIPIEGFSIKINFEEEKNFYELYLFYENVPYYIEFNNKKYIS